MFLTKLLFIFGIVAYMGHSVKSFSCYICDETNKNFEKNCDDDDLEPHELEALKMDCSNVTAMVPPMIGNEKPIATGCVELVLPKLKSLPNEEDKDYTIRTCYFGNVDETNCSISNTHFKIKSFERTYDENCQICTENLCNGSTIDKPIIFGISLLAFIALFTSKFA